MIIKHLLITLSSLTLLVSSVRCQPEDSRRINGFLIKNPLVPVNEIHHGGPPRDGIPAIDNPEFLNAEQADYLKDDDRVLGVVYNGIAKAYPIRIMDWHEIVNDLFDQTQIVITYCPLCGSGLAFKATIKGKNYQFGVSGLLYNSDVLLYDRNTESLWSQIMSKAINGPLKGTTLSMIPTMTTTWVKWKELHPNTKVLSTNTGHMRNYNVTPYQGYDQSEVLYFPVNEESNILNRKDLVLGVSVNGKYKAYPYKHLAKEEKGVITDYFNGIDLTIYFDKDSKSAWATTNNGNLADAYTLFWFAWYAFHPETEIYNP